MHFAIIFKLPNEDCLHVSNLTDSIGMDFVNVVRDEIGAQVPARHISTTHSCPSWNNKAYRLTIETDDTISRIPQFAARELVTVIVPDGFLGKYWNMKITNKGFNQNVGVFKRMYGRYKMTHDYNVEFEIDDLGLLNDWIFDGCPEIWGMEEEKLKSLISPSRNYYIIKRSQYSTDVGVTFNGEMGLGGNVQDIVLSNKAFEEEGYMDVQSVVQEAQLVHTMTLLAGQLNKNDLNRLKDAINIELESKAD